MNINYGKHYIDNIDREEAVKVLLNSILYQNIKILK